MKYPFTPAVLDALPEQIADLFRSLEDTLLEEICKRLIIRGTANEVTLQDIRALRAHGIDLKEILKAISKVSGISETQLSEIFSEAVERNQRYYSQLIDLSGLTVPEHIVDPLDIESITKQAYAELRNITRSMGFLVDGGHTMLPPAKAYQWALDNATMQVQSGAISYNQAISAAVQQLADSGLMVDRKGNDGYVQYESGHRDHIDVAARRAVMTGINQLCAKYTENTAAYLDSHFFEVSAHAGARDVDGPMGWENHKAWQGKVYSTQSGDIYPNIYTVCGLGDVTGLEGANCRHIRSVWVEGVSERTYTDEELANIDKPPFEYEGRRYTTYEATQKQRQIERTVRKLKRRRKAFEAVGAKDMATATTARIRILETKYKEFSKAAGLREQRERMNVVYPKDGNQQKRQSAVTGQNHKQSESRLSDVTNDFVETATPGVGNVTQAAGYKPKRHKEEIEIAEWLLKQFGGNIQLLKEDPTPGVSTADYMWNGRLWELKGVSSINSIDKNVQKAVKQIAKRPGGIILDCLNDLEFDANALIALENRLGRSDLEEAINVIVKSKDAYKILRYR